MRTAKTLIRLGGCPGCSESSLGAQPHCLFCHEAAHLIKMNTFKLNIANIYFEKSDHISNISLSHIKINT